MNIGSAKWLSDSQTINPNCRKFYSAAVLYSDLTGYSTNIESTTDFVIKVYKMF